MDQLIEQPSEEFRSGFVAVVGRPNAGKSTLINRYVGQKVAIVSPKPQTTRRRLLGIVTTSEAQVVFVDTPGLTRPHHRLDEQMMETVRRAIPDADVTLFLVDLSVSPTRDDRQLAELLRDHLIGFHRLTGFGRVLLQVADLVEDSLQLALVVAQRVLGFFQRDVAATDQGFGVRLAGATLGVDHVVHVRVRH